MCTHADYQRMPLFLVLHPLSRTVSLPQFCECWKKAWDTWRREKGLQSWHAIGHEHQGVWARLQCPVCHRGEWTGPRRFRPCSGLHCGRGALISLPLAGKRVIISVLLGSKHVYRVLCMKTLSQLFQLVYCM